MSRNNQYNNNNNASMIPRFRAPDVVKFVTVIDPAFRSGKLQIPVEKTLPTKGRDEWLQGTLRNKDLSLCCLFQRGRCHAQERCHQVHVDRDFMSALREQQSSVVSCCRACRDTATLSSPAMSFLATYVPASCKVHITLNNDGTQFSIIDNDRLAFTAGLVQQFEEHGCRAVNNVVAIPYRRVCRLHMKAACKYGKDCKNVHVCCQLSDFILTPTAATTPTQFQTSPAMRALPEPATKKATASPASTPSAVILPLPAQPLPSFALPSPVMIVVPSNQVSQMPTPVPSVAHVVDPCDSSKSCLSLDPVDITENSGRIRGIIFDALKCMDDSSSAIVPKDEESNFSYFSTSPGQKRRTNTKSASAGTVGANKTLQMGAWHPCSKVVDPTVNPSRVAQFDQYSFFKLFQ